MNTTPRKEPIMNVRRAFATLAAAIVLVAAPTSAAFAAHGADDGPGHCRHSCDDGPRHR